MANENDLTKELDASDEDVASLKKDHYQENAGSTRMKSPVQDIAGGLNQELVNMLALGKRSAQFQGLERCIRILDAGTPNQRHCLSMMVSDLSRNLKMCSSCDRIRDSNAKPTVINSSMIRLTDKELAECGLDKDPLLNTKPEPIKQSNRLKVKTTPRRPKVAVPNQVKIEVTMAELDGSTDLVKTLLNKTLKAVYNLPITKFSEAEAIRGTSERIKSLLKQGE
jgi:hypothetical protein